MARHAALGREPLQGVTVAATELPTSERLAQLTRGITETRDQVRDWRALKQLEITLIPHGVQGDEHMERARALVEAGEQLSQFARDIETTIDSETNQELSKLRTPSGIQAWTEDMKKQIRGQMSERKYGELQATAIEYDAAVEAREQELRAVIDRSRQAPTPRAEVATDTRTLVLFRLHEGRALADVVADYERTPDGAEPMLTYLMEHYAPSEVQRILRLRESDNDVTAISRLQSAIKARGDARQDQAATAELAFLEQDRANHAFGRYQLIKEAKRHQRAPKAFRAARGEVRT
jgi:hypothetical protein